MGDTGGGAAEADSGQTVWRRATSAAYVASPGRVVVLDLDRPELPPYVFEGPAAEIWGLVDGSHTETQIADDLAEAFGAPVEVVIADIGAYLVELRALGLVVAEDGS